MTEGYLLDNTYGGKTAANWVEGEPEKSLWSGLKTADRAVFEVTSWRCDRCGFLENYAN